MTSQKAKTKKILEELEGFGFHPRYIEFLDGYFIFDHGKDMVVHFYIKELKGWKFGIWWDLEDNDKFEFFTQYERDIDKFKPSASTYLAKEVFYGEDLKSEIKIFILPILKFIRKHPYVAWSYDVGCQRDCWKYKTGFEAFIEFWKYKMHLWKNDQINKMLTRKYKKLVEKIWKDKLIEPVIIDENQNGIHCFPRYRIVCKGVQGEKLKPGCYVLNLEEEIEEKLLKKARRFDNRLKKNYSVHDIHPFHDRLDFWVKK